MLLNIRIAPNKSFLYFSVSQVNKNKTWNDVAKALQIKDDKSGVSFLRKQYIKFLFAFECKFDHSLDFLSDHGPEPLRLNHELRRGPDIEKQPPAKRHASANVSIVVHEILYFSDMINIFRIYLDLLGDIYSYNMRRKRFHVKILSLTLV